MILVWNEKLMPTATPIHEVIDFWFSATTQPLWFNSTPAFDREIAERFASTLDAAANDMLESWELTPQGALALVIVLDQFPLNMFRGQARSFATEQLALKVAERAIQRDFDHKLSPQERAFLYMPYMHSEDIQDQDKAVTLYSQAGLQDNLRFAEHHRGIIQRFGRFPHRNAILRRESTRQEREYLASVEAFHG